MENLRSSNNKSNNRKGNFFKFAPILAGALFFMNPNGVNAQNNTSNENRTQAEISTSTILDRLNQKLGISLPDEYNDRVLDFVLNDTIMSTKSATAYTEEFIINEMQKDRLIDKQNQLLFIRSKIYGGISQKKLYNRLDDENESRSGEYKKALKQIATCYEEYKKGFKTYMETKSAEYDKQSAEARQQSAEARQQSAEARQQSAEARQQSAEARQQSAEARQQSAEARQQSAEARQQSAEARQQSAEAIKKIMKLDSIRIDNNLNEFYETYIRNPNIVKQSEIDFMKKRTKEVIVECKEYGIDYRAILLKEVGGDAKKVNEILKFYGVE